MQRNRAKRLVPRILKTPIETSLIEDQRSIARQVDERLQAVFDFYEVDRKAFQSANKLVALMAKDRFPSAFKRRLVGSHKTKKAKWKNTVAREHLLEFFRTNQAPGMSQEDVARLYIKQFCPERSSPKGLVAEFNRAERWERAGSMPTTAEIDEAGEYYVQLQREIRRGK